MMMLQKENFTQHIFRSLDISTLPQVEHIAYFPYRIPLPHSFTTNHETLATRQGIIIEMHLDNNSIGIGESAPLPEFSGGTLQEVHKDLMDLSALLLDMTIDRALEIIYQEPHIAPAARSGLEMALLDALGQNTGQSLHRLLARHTDSIPGQDSSTLSIAVNSVIGTRSLSDMREEAQHAVHMGYHCIKIKMGNGSIIEEITRVQAIRAVIGPHIQLRLDANERWEFAQAKAILHGCDNLHIQYIEQPLARSDLEGMSALRQSVTIPIAADEALSDLDSAQRVLEAGAADILILKPQLAGGLLHSQQILQLAASKGIPAIITSTIETGIGIAAALHLAAASPEITMPCGLTTASLLAHDLLTEPLSIQNGYMAVPNGPGLGRKLDHHALHNYLIT